MMRYLRLLLSFFLLFALAACGGGGGSAGTPIGSSSPANFQVNAPSIATLAVGQKASYSIIGGTAPYKVSVDYPNLVFAEVKGSVLEVTTLRVGSAQVKVSTSDVVSPTSPLVPSYSFSVNVSASASSLVVQVPAETLTLATGVSASYAVTGGSGPYSGLSNNPSVAVAQIVGGNLNITTQRAGDVVVSVVDVMGNRVDVTVKVVTVVAFSTNAPTKVKLAQSAVVEYTVTGGVAPYSITAPEDATVLDATLIGSKFTFVGKKGGVVNVEVRDSAGGKFSIEITVTAGTLSLDAGNSVRATLGSTSVFGIVGGRAPYTAASQAPGVVKASVSGSSLTLVTFTPSGSGTFPSEVIVRLLDSTGTVADIAVNLYSLSNAIDFFTNAGTSLVVPVGNTSIYAVGGGVLPYTVSSSNPLVAKADVTATQLTIKGLISGSTSLILTDAVGTSLSSILVRVGPVGSLYTTAPSTLKMQGAQTQVFSIGGGQPDYSAVSSDISVATVSVVSGGLLSIKTIGNGSAEIKVSDSAGSIAELITVEVTQSAGAAVGGIDLLTDLAQIRSAGDEAQITAVVKNVGNVGMANQSVVFTASSGVLLNPSATTDASGVAKVRLSPGSDKSNRTISVNATVGSVTRTLNVAVVGTQVTISGPTSRQLTTPSNLATYTVRVQDSAGSAISGVVVGLKSKLNNPLSSSSLTTNSGGTGSFTHDAKNAGSDGVDLLTADFSGTSGTLNVSISPIDFTVISPVPVSSLVAAEVKIDTDQLVRVQFRENNLPGKGSINFSTSRGVISAAPGFSLMSGNVPVDANGFAAVNVRSSSAGAATVTAQVPGVGSLQPRAQVAVPLQFVATTPATLVLQSNLGAIPPNPAGSVTNVVDVEATVRDVNANPVANVQVSFVLETDPSNGSLLSAIGVTDANGRVKAQFVAGPNSTSNNGVRVRATVVSAPSVTNFVDLTVNGNSLFITIGFGNEIDNVDQTTYSKVFSVYVNDANGLAVGNQVVTLSVIPTNFRKGHLAWTDPVWSYQQLALPGVSSPTASCPNEDTNRNGILNPGEDASGDGLLTPGNVVVAVPGSVTTGSDGRAVFALQYGEQFVPWVDVTLIARATVSGTESRREQFFPLTGLAGDFNKDTVAPAGRTSPFGASSSCGDRF